MAFKVPNVVGPKPFHQGYALGVVVAKHHNKTLRVIVKRMLKDRKYGGKRFQRYSSLKVHDELNECGLGDLVLVRQSRPHSKTKFFEVADIAKKYAANSFLSVHPEIKDFFDKLHKSKAASESDEL